MHRLAFIALLLVVLLDPARGEAAARPLVGIADQGATMFESPLYGQLGVARISRLVVSYDAVLDDTEEVPGVDAWMAAASAARVQPLVAFNHSRGCFTGTRIAPRAACRLPSVTRFGRAFHAFRKRYPAVRVYSPWNEINHHSQPTARRPDRAAAFYNLLRRRCRSCRVVAADVLDQPGVGRYLRRFRRHVKHRARLWGLHNYQDANNGTTSGTREVLRAVPGEIWLTETGGIVKLGKHRPFSPARAARATKTVLAIARGFRRVTRVYLYNWTGGTAATRFDAGITTPGGRPRPAYKVLRKLLGPAKKPKR